MWFAVIGLTWDAMSWMEGAFFSTSKESQFSAQERIQVNDSHRYQNPTAGPMAAVRTEETIALASLACRIQGSISAQCVF